jgi:hypothetical protein
MRKEKEVMEMGKEIEELRTANVRLVGQANTRQRIQQHRKLKVSPTGGLAGNISF